MQSRNNTFLRISLFYLVIYIFGEFILNQTVFASPLLVYAALLFLGVLFGICLIKYSSTRISKSVMLWFPFILLTCFGYLIHADFQSLLYWVVASFLLFGAVKGNVETWFPYRLVGVIGIVASIGVFFQLFAPSFYNSHIGNLFIEGEPFDQIDRGSGLRGFTYQVGLTANMLLYGEGIMLYAYFTENKKKKLKIILTSLLIIAVFLTGKRTLSVIALVAPFVIYWLSQKKSGKRIFIAFFIVTVFSVVLYYFLERLEQFQDSLLLGRLTDTIIGFESGKDILSGRELLYSKAWEGFQSSPIIGIGVGQFVDWSGLDMAVHNMYLQVLCEQGLIGSFFFITPLLYCLIKCIRMILRTEDSKINNRLKFVLFVQIVFIFYGFTGNPTVNLTGYMMYFIAISIMEGCTNNVNLK